MIRRVWLTGCIGLALAACRDDGQTSEKAVTIANQPFAWHLSDPDDKGRPLKLADPDRIIWRKGPYSLETSQALHLRQAPLVMVEVPHDVTFAPQMPPLASLQTASADYRLFPLPDPEVLQQWASQLHNGKGLGCGRLEQIRFPLNAANSNKKLIAPAYHSSVTLAQVQALLQEINQEGIKATITELENLGSRYHTLASGKNASSKVKDLFAQAGQGLTGFTVNEWQHSGTDQKSIIATLPGNQDPNIKVIVGAHLDSINRNSQKITEAPGADDNASGIAGLVSMIKVLASQQAQFKYTIEFHAYAAEEVGLVGSKDISSSYEQAQAQIAGMLQLDMTAYFAPEAGAKIHIITTDTHINISYDLHALMTGYLSTPHDFASLSAGTSDHKAWTNESFPAGFIFENPDDFNPTYHSSSDQVAKISDLSQAQAMTRLALAFISHYAGLSQADTTYTSLQSDIYPASSKLDLPMAIYDGGSGEYLISITSAIAIDYLHICKIASKSSPSCISTRETLRADGTLGERVNFTTLVPLPLAEGDELRVIAFDANHKERGQRSLRLGAKTD